MRKERRQFVKGKENHDATTYQLGCHQSEREEMAQRETIQHSGYRCVMLNPITHPFLRSHLRFLSKNVRLPVRASTFGNNLILEIRSNSVEFGSSIMA